jgi:hypothetical protein
MSGFLAVLVSYGAVTSGGGGGVIPSVVRKIIASDRALQPGTEFGASVAISGDGNYLVIGAPLSGVYQTG